MHERVLELLEVLEVEQGAPKPLLEGLRENMEEVKDSLLELLEDQDYWDMDAPGKGIGPVKAVELLVDAGVTEAIPLMIDALFELDNETMLYNAITVNMGKLGEVVVEPCLAAMGMDVVTPERLDGLDPTLQAVEGFCCILSQCGAKDERIYGLLLHGLQVDPIWSCMLADYGDPRAVPHIREKLDLWDPEDDIFGPVELADAIERLGGSLAPEHQEIVDLSIELRKEAFADFRKRSRGMTIKHEKPKPKPNAPCWCGSGKKYKKCHLLEDERA